MHLIHTFMTANMETITTNHPLRTITLRYDRSKEAPEFETETLQCYHEIHDRTYAMLQRVQQGRKPVPGFRYEIEGVEWLLDQAADKLEHLKQMAPTNPVRGTVYQQLKRLLSDLDNTLNELVPRLIDESKLFFSYEDYSVGEDEWMEETAFPLFHEIFSRYEDCSLDTVFFDLDLEDFRHTLAFVKKQEGLFLDEMNTVINDFTGFSNRIDTLYGKVSEFDSELIIGM